MERYGWVQEKVDEKAVYQTAPGCVERRVRLGEEERRVLEREPEPEGGRGEIGAGRYERSPTRKTRRNGYRERKWETRVGEMPLKIPKLREGSYFPSLLEPRRRAEKALLAVVQTAYLKGVSTRKVDDPVCVNDLRQLYS